jgi:hypothetical protein
MPIPPIEATISARARAIAGGLVRAGRAAPGSKLIHGVLRIELYSRDDYYWIALDGSRVLRGKFLSDAEELQPKFIDAMERAGR